MAVGALQLVAAIYLMFVIVRDLSKERRSTSCFFENTSSGRLGFLSTLLGPGSECHGYKVRVVGHSLGGSVATVLGMMVKHVKPSVLFRGCFLLNILVICNLYGPNLPFHQTSGAFL